MSESANDFRNIVAFKDDDAVRKALGRAAAALEQAQAKIATHQAQYDNIAGYVKERQERIEQLEAALREASTNPIGEYYTGLHCGIEDKDIYDRYEAADYGWESAFEYAQSIADPLLAELEFNKDGKVSAALWKDIDDEEHK